MSYITFVCHLLDGHLQFMSHEADHTEDDEAGEDTGGTVGTRHYDGVSEENREKRAQTYSYFIKQLLQYVV